MPKLFDNPPEVPIPPLPEMPILDETITDVNKSASYIFFQRNRNVFIIGLLASFAWEFLFIYLMYSWGAPTDNNDPRAFGIYALILPFVIFFVIYNNIKGKLQHEFMQQFAQANNYSYQQNASPANTDGSLFSLGHSQKYEDLISGVYHNKELSLFNFTYVTGSGKSQQTHNDTVFQIEISSPLPNILLINGGLQYSGVIPLIPGLSSLKKLTLEGDFNKYFSLYCKKGFEEEALQIFSPDFMEKTKDDYQDFSIEFINSRVYIYHGGLVSTKDELQKMYSLTEYIITNLDPLLERMKGDVLAMEQVLKQ